MVVLTDTTQNHHKNVELKNHTYEQVSRYAIASIMNHDPKTIVVKKSDDIYYATYMGADIYYTYKVTFKGDQILWAVKEGRWRDTDADEKIYFEEEGVDIKIIQSFSDGSESIDVYNK
jgi:hypothetical protein